MISSDFWNVTLGLADNSGDLSAAQMAVRAVLVYIVALAIIRLGKKRFLGRATAFDVIIGFVLGSIASRAITGNAPLWPAMTSIAVLMAFHWLLTGIALRSHTFGTLIKARSRMLIRDGQVDEKELRSAHMTDYDLREALRQNGVREPEEVAEARLERDGSVSVIKAAQ